MKKSISNTFTVLVASLLLSEGNAIAGQGYTASGDTIPFIVNNNMPNETPVAAMTATNTIFSGSVQVNTNTADCTTNLAGAIRFNQTTKNIEGCNGTGWQTLNSTASYRLTNPGYVKFAFGLVIEWGTNGNCGAQNCGVGFPLQFPNTPFVGLATSQDNTATNNCVATYDLTRDGMAVALCAPNLSYSWLVIGF